MNIAVSRCWLLCTGSTGQSSVWGSPGWGTTRYGRMTLTVSNTSSIWWVKEKEQEQEQEQEQKKEQEQWNFILRFILPCKSDCQPIFLKKQGINSFYAKLWLLRSLIKNVPDSSHRYGSNVTFGASTAFQMREKYVFEKKYFLKTRPQGRYAILHIIIACF